MLLCMHARGQLVKHAAFCCPCTLLCLCTVTSCFSESRRRTGACGGLQRQRLREEGEEARQRRRHCCSAAGVCCVWSIERSTVKVRCFSSA